MPIVFFSDLNQDFSMNKVDGPVEINECILANVSETEDLANISRLNLLLSIANEKCYQQIKDGRLYLQGTVYISGQLKLLSFFKDIFVLFIPFFCFWSLLATKLLKYENMYYVIFVYILQGKMGKTEKITKLK